jgi:hypothetical protein
VPFLSVLRGNPLDEGRRATAHGWLSPALQPWATRIFTFKQIICNTHLHLRGPLAGFTGLDLQRFFLLAPRGSFSVRRGLRNEYGGQSQSEGDCQYPRHDTLLTGLPTRADLQAREAAHLSRGAIVVSSISCFEAIPPGCRLRANAPTLRLPSLALFWSFEEHKIPDTLRNRLVAYLQCPALAPKRRGLGQSEMAIF